MHYRIAVLVFFSTALLVNSRSVQIGAKDFVFSDGMESPEVLVRDAWKVDSPVMVHDEECPKGFQKDLAGMCREVFYEDYIDI